MFLREPLSAATQRLRLSLVFMLSLGSGQALSACVDPKEPTDAEHDAATPSTPSPSNASVAPRDAGTPAPVIGIKPKPTSQADHTPPSSETSDTRDPLAGTDSEDTLEPPDTTEATDATDTSDEPSATDTDEEAPSPTTDSAPSADAGCPIAECASKPNDDTEPSETTEHTNGLETDLSEQSDSPARCDAGCKCDGSCETDDYPEPTTDCGEDLGSLSQVVIDATELDVEYVTYDANANSAPAFQVRLRNTGLMSVNLKNITVRYWFTSDDVSFQVVLDRIDASIQGATVTAKATPDGTEYLELAYPDMSLLNTAGDINDTELSIRLQVSDQQTFDQSNDWSWSPTSDMWETNDRITIYRDDPTGKPALVWGSSPCSP